MLFRDFVPILPVIVFEFGPDDLVVEAHSALVNDSKKKLATFFVRNKRLLLAYTVISRMAKSGRYSSKQEVDEIEALADKLAGDLRNHIKRLVTNAIVCY